MASHLKVRWRFVRGHDKPRLMGVAPSTFQVVLYIKRIQMASKITLWEYVLFFNEFPVNILNEANRWSDTRVLGQRYFFPQNDTSVGLVNDWNPLSSHGLTLCPQEMEHLSTWFGAKGPYEQGEKYVKVPCKKGIWVMIVTLSVTLPKTGHD